MTKRIDKFIKEPNIKAVFFDIGGTLVMKEKNKQRDFINIQAMMTLLGETGVINKFISTLEQEENKYKAWSKQTLSESTIEDRWISFLVRAILKSSSKPTRICCSFYGEPPKTPN